MPAASTQKPKPTLKQRVLKEIRGYAEAIAIAYVVITFGFNTVGVVGSSMQPNLDGGTQGGSLVSALLTGDRVFIPKYETWLRRLGVMPGYERGQVVVVREPANAPTAQERDRRPFFIKRVIGVPGDRVRIEDGVVQVNGVAVDDGFIRDSGEIIPDLIHFPLVEVEDGVITGLHVEFGRSRGGTAIPRIPTAGLPPAVSVDDPSVDLYYGTMIDNLVLPDGTPQQASGVRAEVQLPADRYWIMGDNRQISAGGSEDSRYFGSIEGLTIAGRGSAVIWPPRRDGQWNWRSLTPPSAFNEVPAP
jgi:signal peptidase I